MNTSKLEGIPTEADCAGCGKHFTLTDSQRYNAARSGNVTKFYHSRACVNQYREGSHPKSKYQPRFFVDSSIPQSPYEQELYAAHQQLARMTRERQQLNAVLSGVLTLQEAVDFIAKEGGSETVPKAETLKKACSDGRLVAVKKGESWLTSHGAVQLYLETFDPKHKAANNE